MANFIPKVAAIMTSAGASRAFPVTALSGQERAWRAETFADGVRLAAQKNQSGLAVGRHGAPDARNGPTAPPHMLLISLENLLAGLARDLNLRHSALISSPSSRRSFITELAFHGILTSPKAIAWRKCYHVAGMECLLCLRTLKSPTSLEPASRLCRNLPGSIWEAGGDQTARKCCEARIGVFTDHCGRHTKATTSARRSEHRRTAFLKLAIGLPYRIDVPYHLGDFGPGTANNKVTS